MFPDKLLASGTPHRHLTTTGWDGLQGIKPGCGLLGVAGEPGASHQEQPCGLDSTPAGGLGQWVWHSLLTCLTEAPEMTPRGELCCEQLLSHSPNIYITLIRSGGKICHRQLVINYQLFVSQSFHSFTDAYLVPSSLLLPVVFSFSLNFLKHLLRFCCVPGSVHGTGHVRMNQTPTLASRAHSQMNMLLSVLEVVLVVYCYVTNYSEVQWLKTTFIMSQFLRNLGVA